MAGGEGSRKDPLGRGGSTFLGGFGRGFETGQTLSPYQQVQRSKQAAKVAERKAREAGATPYQISQAGKAAREAPIPAPPPDVWRPGDPLQRGGETFPGGFGSGLGLDGVEEVQRLYDDLITAGYLSEAEAILAAGQLESFYNNPGLRAALENMISESGIGAGPGYEIPDHILQQALGTLASGPRPEELYNFDGLASEIAVGGAPYALGPVTADAYAPLLTDQQTDEMGMLAARIADYDARMKNAERMASAERDAAATLAGLRESADLTDEAGVLDVERLAEELKDPDSFLYELAPDELDKVIHNKAVTDLLNPSELYSVMARRGKLKSSIATRETEAGQMQTALASFEAFRELPKTPTNILQFFKDFGALVLPRNARQALDEGIEPGKPGQDLAYRLVKHLGASEEELQAAIAAEENK